MSFDDENEKRMDRIFEITMYVVVALWAVGVICLMYINKGL